MPAGDTLHALAERMWDLRHDLPVYDAAYIALAELVGSPLLTADAAMTAVADVGCPVELIA